MRADSGHDDGWDVEQEDNIVPLSRSEAERLFGAGASRPSRVTPVRVVMAQVVLSLVATAAWWLLSSRPGVAALSAFLGGAIGWVPSALFALWLEKMRGRDSVFGWMVGQALKAGTATAMLVAVAYGFREVLWLPLLTTCLLALKAYWLALAWR